VLVLVIVIVMVVMVVVRERVPQVANRVMGGVGMRVGMGSGVVPARGLRA